MMIKCFKSFSLHHKRLQKSEVAYLVRFNLSDFFHTNTFSLSQMKHVYIMYIIMQMKQYQWFALMKKSASNVSLHDKNCSQ